MIHIILPMLQGLPGTTNQIINGSFYNISSFTSLFHTTNAAVGGLEGSVVSLILFMVFLGASSFKVKLIDAAVVASGLCMLLSVLLQLMQLTGNLLPLLWLGATILFGMTSLLSGWTRPYD